MTSFRIDWSQQLVIDTHGGADASGTVPEDTDPSFNKAMYGGNGWWLMSVAKSAHFINIGAAATSANALFPAGTVIHALAEAGATTNAQVSFVKVYPN